MVFRKTTPIRKRWGGTPTEDSGGYIDVDLIHQSLAE